MTNGRHVQRTLMRTPRFQRTFDQRAIEETLDNPVMRSCRLAALDHGHFCPLCRMPADRRIDGAAPLEIPAHQYG